MTNLTLVFLLVCTVVMTSASTVYGQAVSPSTHFYLCNRTGEPLNVQYTLRDQADNPNNSIVIPPGDECSTLTIPHYVGVVVLTAVAVPAYSDPSTKPDQFSSSEVRATDYGVVEVFFVNYDCREKPVRPPMVCIDNLSRLHN